MSREDFSASSSKRKRTKLSDGSSSTLDTYGNNKYRWTSSLSDLFTFSAICKQTIESPVFFFGSSFCHFIICHSSRRDDLKFLVRVAQCENSKTEMFYWRIDILRADSSIFKSEHGMYQHDCSTDGLEFDLNQLKEEAWCLTVDCELSLQNNIVGREQECAAPKLSKIASISRTDLLLKNLKELLFSGDASDVTIRVNGNEFKAHRCILGSRSPVFFAMFKNDMTEKISGVVDIEDCEVETFMMFLSYVYTGRVEVVTPEETMRLYRVANKYQLQGLQEDCLAIIKQNMSVKYICNIISFGINYSEMSLLNRAKDFFAKNMKNIIVTKEWEDFLGENHILANELLIEALGAKKPVFRF